jgi:uncharacterized membrane protein YphA (DoxX/SURF4 family)
MTIYTLFLYVGIAAVALTALMRFIRKPESMPIEFISNFVGALFIFSGFVKAVDPIGTALKMKDYFGEFEIVFHPNISWIFPILSEWALTFSIVMIVLEIVIGVNLILGLMRKFTAITLMFIILFFLVLTGYTCLTGYTIGAMGFILSCFALLLGVVAAYMVERRTPKIVFTLLGVVGFFTANLLLNPAHIVGDNPAVDYRFNWTVDRAEEEFVKKENIDKLVACNMPVDTAKQRFAFGKFSETGQRITDCGCFGDFLKLKPCTSFWKDVFLLPLALLLVFGWKRKTPLTEHKIVGWLVPTLTTIFFLWFCLKNSSWGEPMIDFRPFAEGVNIKAKKEACMKDIPKVNKVFTILDVANCKTMEMTSEDYMKPESKHLWDKDKYPIISTKEVKIAEGCNSKIKEFEISSPESGDMTDSLLNDANYWFLAVAYDLHETKSTVELPTFTFDSVLVAGTTDSFNLVKRQIGSEKATKVTGWDAHYGDIYKKTVNPFAEAAEKAGSKFVAVTKLNDPETVEAFRFENQTAFPVYQGEEKMLKTIIRSNPGIILMKGDKIIKKWHWKALPSFDEVKNGFMK